MIRVVEHLLKNCLTEIPTRGRKEAKQIAMDGENSGVLKTSLQQIDERRSSIKQSRQMSTV